MPTVLGIESSCDETAAAICKDGQMLSNVVASQAIHAQYGGVVPEFAARDHIRNIIPVLDEAMAKAAIALHEIDAIAYTSTPGLIGSLLIGAQFAKSLALCWNKPLYAVNHLHAHVASSAITHTSLAPPFLCLLVSGGHTQIVRCQSWVDMQLLGETLDDAAGEAFDKSARLLGFPYPGGVHVEKHAAKGDSARFSLPIAQLTDNNYSFSGLKTAVRHLVENGKKKAPDFVAQHLNDLCASIQNAIVEALLIPLPRVIQQQQLHTLTVAGGVAANAYLRSTVIQRMSNSYVSVYMPDKAYCGDNAAMIAWLAEKYVQVGALPTSWNTAASARLA